jgi:two-component system nitrate/nitrite response regulator NarL
MGPNSPTAVVEARLLVREALKSLMANQSYRVVCDVGSTVEISTAAISDEPELVVLGAQSAENAVAEADALRKLWPDSKIVVLYEHASPADVQKLLTSEIDGCVPLFASSDALIGTLNAIATRDVRVMIASASDSPPIQAGQPERSHRSDIKMDKRQAGTAEHSATGNSDTQTVNAVGIVPRLSGREVQVLDGLLKGHANKVIARTCDIAEATVKVHVKGILRKIRVANRTQAAIWALESGYSAGEGRPL